MKASSAARASAGRARAAGETIGEVAAIARHAASHGEAVPPATGPMPVEGEDRYAPHEASMPHGRNASAAPAAGASAGAERAPEPVPLRRSRAGAGLVKEPVHTLADRTAMHLILAGRAYAYGQRIVRKDEGKLGDVLAIKS